MMKSELDFCCDGFLKMRFYKQDLLCKNMACVDCPLSPENNGTGISCSDYMGRYPEDFVKKLNEAFDMKNRPTWGEYLEKHIRDEIPAGIWRLFNDKQGS